MTFPKFYLFLSLDMETNTLKTNTNTFKTNTNTNPNTNTFKTHPDCGVFWKLYFFRFFQLNMENCVFMWKLTKEVICSTQNHIPIGISIWGIDCKRYFDLKIYPIPRKLRKKVKIKRFLRFPNSIYKLSIWFY